MLLCDINDNVLNSHPSYSGVYQDEAKKIFSQRDNFLFCVETK